MGRGVDSLLGYGSTQRRVRHNELRNEHGVEEGFLCTLDGGEEGGADLL